MSLNAEIAQFLLRRAAHHRAAAAAGDEAEERLQWAAGLERRAHARLAAGDGEQGVLTFQAPPRGIRSTQ